MDSLERRREDPQSINQNVEMRPISSGDEMNQIFLLLCKYPVPDSIYNLFTSQALEKNIK